ncbi:hypothetical protein Tco_1106233 [Tanacetum coccineum]
MTDSSLQQRSINAPAEPEYALRKVEDMFAKGFVLGEMLLAKIIEYEVGDVVEILPRQSSKAINHYTLQSEPSINLNTPHTPAKGGGAVGRPKGGKNKTAPHMSVSNTDEAC